MGMQMVWLVGMTCAVSACVTCGTAPGEVVTDGSLGARGPVARVAGDYRVGAELGKRSGDNLFHSFSQLDIPEGESATFVAPPSVSNIFARVTGGTASRIDGTLRSRLDTGGEVWHPANFYLINNAGAIFGPGSSLEVAGRFTVTTADRIRFADGRFFDSTPSPSDVVLSTASPNAFGFLGARPPAPITIERPREISTPKKQDIPKESPQELSVSIIGGNFVMNGGELFGRLGDQVNVVCAGAAGEVVIDDPADVHSDLLVESLTALGDAAITGAIIKGDDGAGVHIRARNLALSDALIQSANFKKKNVEAHGIHLDLSGDLVLQGNSAIRTGTLGSNAAGDIGIHALDVLLSGGRGMSFIRSEAVDPEGSVGKISIDARSLQMIGPAEISSEISPETSGTKSGDIILNLSGAMLLAGGTAGATIHSASSFPDDTHIGGSIVVSADSLRLTGTAEISSIETDQGDGGKIDLRIRNALDLAGPDPALNRIYTRAGKGGDISISSGTLATIDPIQIFSATFAGVGPTPGTVTINGVVPPSAPGAVVLDGSIRGPVGTPPMPLTLGGPDFAVDETMGRYVEGNLFFSFSRLDLAASESLTFGASSEFIDSVDSHPVKNILARVTGGSSSFLNGRLAVYFALSPANLFLINPAGIIFGPTAQLDLPTQFNPSTMKVEGGSFFAGTVSQIKLLDGASFHATPSPADDILTGAKPAAFGFAQTPAPLTLLGANITLQDQQVLSLVGGKMSIRGGSVGSADGRINLIAAASPGEVAFDASDPASLLSLKSFSKLGEINIQGYVTLRSDFARVANFDITPLPAIDISGVGNRSITMRGSSLNLVAAGIDARVLNPTADDPTTERAPGPQIDIQLSGPLQLLRGRIDTSTQEKGSAGSVVIDSGPILLDGGGSSTAQFGIFSESSMGPVKITDLGNSGSININTSHLQVMNGARISTSTQTQGSAGSITVATEELSMSREGAGPTGIFSDTSLTNDPSDINIRGGNGGSATISAHNVSVLAGATVDVSTHGSGQGGSIVIDSTGGAVTIDAAGTSRATALRAASDPFLNVPKTQKIDDSGAPVLIDANVKHGNGGNIVLQNVGVLSVLNDSSITTATETDGNGGKITIGAGSIGPGSIVLRNDGGIVAAAQRGAELDPKLVGKTLGNAGDIDITANAIELRQGGRIRAATDREGRGGNIQLTVKNDLALDAVDGQSFTRISAETAGTGKAGDVHLDVGTLSLHNGARIAADSAGRGNGGSIVIKAATSLLLDTASRIDVASIAEGNSGIILVTAPGAMTIDGPLTGISAKTAGKGTGGNVRIAAGDLTLSNGGRIESASTGEFDGSGDAGLVAITAAHFTQTSGAVVSTAAVNSANIGDGTSDHRSIDIQATSDIRIEDGKIIAFAKGNGGNIFLNAPQTIRIVNSELNAQSLNGNGGNLNIGPVPPMGTGKARSRSRKADISSPRPEITIENSKLIASATGMGNGGTVNGGDVNITAQFLLKSTDTLVDVSSAFGTPGTVRIDAPYTDAVPGLPMLAGALAAPGARLQELCGMHLGGDVSSFVSIGGGGVPLEPGALEPGLDVPPAAPAGASR